MGPPLRCRDAAIAAAAIALLAGAALKAQQDAPRQPLADRFQQLDANGDGRLAPDELASPRLFRRLDRNNDGVVTWAEASRLP